MRTLQACELGLIKNDDVLELMVHFPELRIRLSNFSRVGQLFSDKGATKQLVQKLRKEGSEPKKSGDVDEELGDSESLMAECARSPIGPQYINSIASKSEADSAQSRLASSDLQRLAAIEATMKARFDQQQHEMGAIASQLNAIIRRMDAP